MFRILKITSYYKVALEYYYDKFPQVSMLSFDEQLNHLLGFGLGWADYYKKAFEKLGVEAFELIANAKSMQQAWAQENNVKYDKLSVLLNQIETIKPDVIWFQDSMIFPADFYNKVRKINTVKLLIGNCCTPYTKENIEVFKKFDFVTSCSPLFIDDFKNHGIKTLLLYHAFDRSILKETETKEKQFDVFFSGSIIGTKGFHFERKKMLEHIINSNVDLKLYGFADNSTIKDFIKKSGLYTFIKVADYTGLSFLFNDNEIYRKGKQISSFPVFNRISKKLKEQMFPPVFGIDMYKQLAAAKISLNKHGEVASGYAVNMRMFETTGVGSILMTENYRNLTELFKPDEEVVTYNSFDEAVEKINWLLDNPGKMKQIALEGQKRTLHDHSYGNRAKIIVEEIMKYL